MTDPLTRFSTRVGNYVKYRPTYPPETVQLLKDCCGLNDSSLIADIGSGTGISSELFLRNSNSLFGVEPNEAMRTAAEQLLAAYPQFVSVNGTAEATTLANNSVDFIVAAQAFHWFDQDEAKREFVRILRPGGWVVLIWNERLLDTSAFLKGYEDLLMRFGVDYQQVRHENVASEIAAFFAPEKFELKVFKNAQNFDFASLKGRLLSSSYVPEATHPTFNPMLAKLEELFEANQRDGKVSFDYETKIYFGHFMKRNEPD
ncbi:MAG TPA: class I SAM-dependent methyltransferase [Pyrinomonadaceae bacterium]|nr:class I SAM-dependent methyltransferase [Pyrinomonadaceae bacterium]